jgi:hypothetical protein
MYREMFNDNEKVSTNLSLIQRKQQSTYGEKLNVNTKEITSVMQASSTRKFHSNRIQKHAATMTTFQSLKSFFNCSSTKKIDEKTELNYPLNLHLQMNQIFAMHDKLCEISERFNDQYSIGMF